MKTCFACGTELVSIFPDGMPTEIQYEGVLYLEIDGGYGMYYDDENKGPTKVLICKPCVDTTRIVIPWFNRLLDEVS